VFCSKGKSKQRASQWLAVGGGKIHFERCMLLIMLSHLPAGVISISSFMVGESRYSDMIVTMRRKRGYAMMERLNFSF
jgi:hypothetical protein